MRRLLIVSLLFLSACAGSTRPTTVPASVPTASTDAALQAQLEALVRPFAGDVGVYVRHLPSGREAAIRADEVFPTASMVKVTLLCRLLDRVERGEIGLDSALTYNDSLLYEGEDLLGSFKSGEPIQLSKLVMLMCTMSDNTASLWIQSLDGGGAAVNGWLAANGFDSTRVNSRTPGRQGARERYGWGQTTPREMATLMGRITDGRAVSPGASEWMTRALSRSYWTGEALSQIPPNVHVASKQGAVNASRSEVLRVDSPGGAYLLCVITKNQQDESWVQSNAGFQLLRDVSRTVYRHFNPTDPWRPVAPDAFRQSP